jgi:hypothetical protein
MNSTERPLDEALEARLTAWLDGELAPAEAQALEALLEADPELRGEVLRIRQTLGLIRGRQGAPPSPPPQQTLEAVHRRLRRRSRGHQFRPRAQGLGFESLILVAMLVALLLAAQTLVFTAAGDLEIQRPRVVLHLEGPLDPAVLTELGAAEFKSPEGCLHWELTLGQDWTRVSRSLAHRIRPLERVSLESLAANPAPETVLAIYPQVQPEGCPKADRRAR